VLASLLPSWLGWAASQALIGWLIFASTHSAFLVGLAFVLRFTPLALAGVPSGALSDRFGRVGVLVGSNALCAFISFVLAVIAIAGNPAVVVLLLASAGYGMGDSARMVSGQNLAYDLSGELGPTRAIAMANLTSAVGQVIGGAVAGITLGTLGSATTAVVVGIAYATGALSLVGLPTLPTAPPRQTQSLRLAIREGLRLLHELPVVRLLIGVALIVEVFGFSGMALDPVFAGAVFRAGPGALGAILAARATGRIVGAALLVFTPARSAIGRWLAIAVLVFGASLVGYAVAPALFPALILMWLTGVASVVVDSLEQTALQAGVSATARGRASGLWVLTVGLGPVGVLEVGFVAQVLGARLAQAANGVIVVAFGLILLGKFGHYLRSIATVSAVQ
jgi:hypothetical protein